MEGTDVTVQQLCCQFKVSGDVFKLTVSFELRPSGDVFHILTTFRGKQWSIIKSLQQLTQLFKSLEKQTFDVQFSVKFLQKTDKIRQNVQQELQKLIKRRDVWRLGHLTQFLKIQEYFTVQKQALIPSSSIQLQKMEAVDFAYEPQHDVIITIEAIRRKRDKLKNFFSNLMGQQSIFAGRLAIYKSNSIIWQQQLKNRPLCMHWNAKTTMLLVGMDNHQIIVWRVAVQKQYSQVDQFTCIKTKSIHFQVMMTAYASMCYGLSVNQLTVYSIKQSKQINNFKSNLKNAACSIDQANNRIFVADEHSLINVFAIETNGQPKVQCCFGPSQPFQVTCLELSSDGQYLLAGTAQSQILVFQVFRKGKEKLSQHISTISCPSELKTLSFSKQLKQVFVNYLNGFVAIGTNHHVERALQNHTAKVTKVRYYHKNNMLVSCGQDMRIVIQPYP